MIQNDMAVIIKRDKKIKSLAKELPQNYSEQGFNSKFRDLYPNDLDKIVNNYNDHVRKYKKGKTFPMPQPEQYLTNALKVWIKKDKSNE